MEVDSCSSFEKSMSVCSVMEAFVAETVLAASKSLTCLFLLSGSLLQDVNGLPKLNAIDDSFPFEELHKTKHPDPDVKDASETEEDDDEDDDNADDQDDDDANDEDFSGGEEGDEDGDPEDDPEANGDGGSDDDDEDDDDEDGDEDEGEEEEEEEEDEDDDEVPQPPSKRRK